MTQYELAKKLGYKSRSSINKIEMGQNDLSQSKIVEFAKVLDISLDEIMGWKIQDIQNSLSSEIIKATNSVDEFVQTLTLKELELVRNYRKLNAEGKEKLNEYADDLVASGKYNQKDYSAEMASEIS